MDSGIVTAKYSYDYKNGNGQIARMAPGDVFMLIKKANDDWWYVRKEGDKPVYLPATYLKEQESTSSQGGNGVNVERKDQASRHGNHNSMMQEMLNKKFTKNQAVNVTNDESSQQMSKPRSRPTNLDVIIPAPDSGDRIPSPYSGGSSPLFTPSRENSWNSTGNSGGVVKNPASVTRNDWAVRLPANDSNYQQGGYDVPNTGPRAPQKLLPGQGGSTPHSPTTAVPPSGDPNVPPGWRVEQTITRDPVFINEVTSVKWFRATPSDGKPYFYSEDRKHTCWELPEVDKASPQRRRMVSDGGLPGDEDLRGSRLGGPQTRHGEGRPMRPHSFHPMARPSSPHLPASQFINKSEFKRRHTTSRSSGYDIVTINDVVREKEGTLTLMLMKDRGRQKKVRPGHALLAGSQLKFYKDYKHYERDVSNPEVSIHLWRADVCWTRSKTARRITFELTTDQGQLYLLQGEDEASSMSWFEALRGAISGQGRHWNPLSPVESDDTVSPSLSSPSIPPPSYNDAHTLKKNNIRERLWGLLSSRPAKDDLKRKGILQEENVFGKDISKLCEKERTYVPNFVTQCINYIDRRGLQCDGIYRVSGNLSMIQKLRFQVDQEKPVDLDSSPWKDDIHVIAGALKLYFRELPEPLFTFATFDSFTHSMTQLQDREQKITVFSRLFREMPRVNYESILALFSHLRRVTENVDHNRMPAKNLATVFGPTLMWPERENMNMTMALVYQNQVMEFVLLEFDNIFR